MPPTRPLEDAPEEEPTELTLLFEDPSNSANEPYLLRRDSEFTVGSEYHDASPNNLNVWQGALLLVADCMGTGILALPGNMQILGFGLGMGFLVANLPINFYAGYTLCGSATYVEELQGVENNLWHRFANDDNWDNTIGSTVTVQTSATAHTQLHHDTATYDFIGMTRALFPRTKTPTRMVLILFYVNIFLVLGNYILVMSHAVTAAWGDEICLPTSGIFSSVFMFLLVSHARTMASLGRIASGVSLVALLLVIALCLHALRNKHDEPSDNPTSAILETSSWLQKLAAAGSIGFAVGSQKLLLNIRHELAQRSRAPQSLALGLGIFGVAYISVILLAGPNPPAFLLDALPAGPLRRLAGGLLWMHVVVSYALNSQALCSSLHRLVHVKSWVLLSAVVAVLAYTIANAVPFFADLVALIGAVTSVPVTLILPAIYGGRVLRGHSLASGSLLAFGIAFTVTATLGSLSVIRGDWATQGRPFACH